MKKLLILVVLAALGLGVFWYLNPDRQPDWAADYVPDDSNAKTIMYKWQDDSGQWHLSDSPPDDTSYERVEVRRNANVLPDKSNDG